MTPLVSGNVLVQLIHAAEVATPPTRPPRLTESTTPSKRSTNSLGRPTGTSRPILALSDQNLRGRLASQGLVGSGTTLAKTIAMLMLLARKPTAPAPRSASSRIASLACVERRAVVPWGWGCSR